MSTPRTVWLNGNFMDQSKATVSITDYGFNYGAGVYEVTRVEQGKVYQLDEHINRFYSSCEKIGLSLKQNKDEIKRVSFELVNLNKEQNAIIYYQVPFLEATFSKVSSVFLVTTTSVGNIWSL
jgi:branched-subunit amino acid aminotransferase/4-amino-4-deoxychorismate lyase